MMKAIMKILVSLAVGFYLGGMIAGTAMALLGKLVVGLGLIGLVLLLHRIIDSVF